MLAVMEDAILNLRSSDCRARTEAELWMRSAERRYAFSFAVVCEELGLEPSAVRRSVIGLLDKTPAGRRLLPRARPNVRHSGKILPSLDHGKAASASRRVRAQCGRQPVGGTAKASVTPALGGAKA